MAKLALSIERNRPGQGLPLLEHVDDDERPQAIAALAPLLGVDQRSQALEMVFADAGDFTWWLDALKALAPFLDTDQRSRFQLASAMEDEGRRADALEALAPVLDDGQRSHALQVATLIGEELVRSETLARLAPFLAADQQRQTLVTALQTVAQHRQGIGRGRRLWKRSLLTSW